MLKNLCIHVYKSFIILVFIILLFIFFFFMFRFVKICFKNEIDVEKSSVNVYPKDLGIGPGKDGLSCSIRFASDW